MLLVNTSAKINLKVWLLGFTVLIVFQLISTVSLSAQNLQTIRGNVVDVESQIPLIGVNVIVWLDDSSKLGAVTDVQGAFILENVPVGRRTLQFTYIGYKPQTLSNLVLTSGKQLVLNIALEPSFEVLKGVEIKAQKAGEVRNELAVVSARTFSVDETNRYAGSRGDPGRMASNFAGVQGADDSRNDIVIRGNSPQGVLWRLEGVNIPNPNHFAISGTSGGPVSILNNKFLSNSDFYTGAFPAEFGNSVAGVFDLKMRNGNNSIYEHSAQVGLLGLELTSEGPISKGKKSSYLGMFRYSTLAAFGFLGINLGTDAIPTYYDGAFRLNFPQKGGGNLSFFGLGGYSDIDIVLSSATEPDTATLIYGENDRDQYFGSQMAVGGISYSKPINDKSYFKATMSSSFQRAKSNHNRIYRHVNTANEYVIDSLPPIQAYIFDEMKYSAYFIYNRKLGLSGKTTLRAGVNFDWFHENLIDSVRLATGDTAAGSIPQLDNWRVRWHANQGFALVQPFVQLKHNPNDKLTLTAGLTALASTINKESISFLEPRVGLKYNLTNNQQISLGGGLHSQMQSSYLYFYGDSSVNRNPQEANLSTLGLTKSCHAVLGYTNVIPKPGLMLKMEAYYQYLFDVPITAISSSFSLVNTGTGFSRFFPDSLTNGGVATNYGVEVTLEKFFSRGYYFLVTGSLFQSEYKGSDNIWRNTTFNGQYTVNTLFAKEFKVGENNLFQIGGKATYAGGRWYGYVNQYESARQLQVVFDDATVNTRQFQPYFRADIKLNYLINRPKVSHEFAIDLVNVTGYQNILSLTYAPDHPSGEPIRQEYQLGFLPIFYYKIDF